jgi:transcriptional regulator with XRE-family HTH domain
MYYGGTMMAAMQNGGMIVEVLSTRLRSLRRARGWSQEELADRAGLEQTQISSWERGSRRPSMESVAKLAAAFGMPHADLAREFGYIDEPYAEPEGPKPGDIPPALVTAMQEMVRDHPELAAQFEAHKDEDDFPAQVRVLARALNYTVRGWLADQE